MGGAEGAASIDVGQQGHQGTAVTSRDIGGHRTQSEGRVRGEDPLWEAWK